MSEPTFVERRTGIERRRIHGGPPPGLTERRAILSRRILNLDSHSLADWLAAKPAYKTRQPRR